MTRRLSAILVILSAPSVAAADAGGVAMAAVNWQPAAVVAGLPGPASLVAANDRTSCAVVSDNLYCWGRLNPVGIEASSATPRLIPGARGITQLSLGALGACALTVGKQVVCWGYAFSSKTPKPVPGLAGARKVSTGEAFACALRTDGRVACWGDNNAGQLGQHPPDPAQLASRPKPLTPAEVNRREVLKMAAALGGSRNDPAPPSPPKSARPMVVPLLDDVVDLAAGKHHACAVRSTGEVVCWGDRSIEHGPDAFDLAARRGPDAPPRDPDAPKPGESRVIRSGERFTVPNLTDAIAVSALDRESCALGRDGAISCLSHYYHRTPLVGPKRCHGVANVRALGDHARWALLSTGEVVRVGESSCYDPKPEAGITDAVEVSGGGHACARTSDGKVLCFGVNDEGQLARPPTPALHIFH